MPKMTFTVTTPDGVVHTRNSEHAYRWAICKDFGRGYGVEYRSSAQPPPVPEFGTGLRVVAGRRPRTVMPARYEKALAEAHAMVDAWNAGPQAGDREAWPDGLSRFWGTGVDIRRLPVHACVLPVERVK